MNVHFVIMTLKLKNNLFYYSCDGAFLLPKLSLVIFSTVIAILFCFYLIKFFYFSFTTL